MAIYIPRSTEGGMQCKFSWSWYTQLFGTQFSSQGLGNKKHAKISEGMNFHSVSAESGLTVSNTEGKPLPSEPDVPTMYYEIPKLKI